MKPFLEIVDLHEDVSEGKLTMEVFAADLWQVVEGTAPDDYRKPEFFFRKTYLTRGLKNILKIAENRLRGASGDAVIQLQTPFGGGKTHTLIALYHRAKEWGANVVVLDGTAFDPQEVRLWEELERQLTGKVNLTAGSTSPGKSKLTELLSRNSPVLVLMDELLEYATKAAGVKVGDSNLKAQTLAFLQELTAAVSTVGNALLVLTLPSSLLEHYDENATATFNQLQKIIGRVEKVYTPVEEEEIEHVVKARLFERIDEEAAKEVVNEFVEYAQNQGLLSEEKAVTYRERFFRSYPFKPEVIDTLYKKWGSFPTFQRTRGVLRLLSLVVHDLKTKNTTLPFIRLSDFDLENEEIRRELVKHIGQEWDSIISNDITSPDSGAKLVDNAVPSSYRNFNLGTAVSTAIFLLSFSGRGERENTVKDVVLSTLCFDLPGSVINEALNELRERLFYLSDEGLFFTNQPNLNKIVLVKEENVSREEIAEKEKELLRAHVSKQSRFKICLHPKFPRDVPDNTSLKLVICSDTAPNREMLEKCGDSPRVRRNTLVFLCEAEGQRDGFETYLKRLLALESIKKSRALNLSENQKKELEKKLKTLTAREYEELRKLYRKIFLPAKEGFKELDMGHPTYGENFLDKEVLEFLASEQKILRKLAPKLLKGYLKNRDYTETRQIYDTLLNTPGEFILMSEKGLVESIKEGVERGLFGLGFVEDGSPRCLWFKKVPQSVDLSEGEVIIRPELCEEEKKESAVPSRSETSPTTTGEPDSFAEPSVAAPGKTTPSRKNLFEKTYKNLELTLDVPFGHLSDLNRILSVLSSRFTELSISVTIRASNGEITSTEYDNVLEAIAQSHIALEREKKK